MPLKICLISKIYNKDQRTVNLLFPVMIPVPVSFMVQHT